jgi:integrase
MMATGKISKRTADALTPATKDGYLWDSMVKGFALKVTPRGTKTYLFEYKDDRRKTRRVTIGHHGVITAEQARDKAKVLAAEVDLGGNPAAERSDRKSAVTVSALAEQWIEEHVAARRKAKTLHDYRGWLDRHILPLIGSMRVPEVRSRDIENVVRSLSDRPTTANRVLAVISSMFTFAIRQHIVRDNPARGIERYEEARRTRHLSPEELNQLGIVLRKAEKRGDNQAGIDAVRILLLTGMRRSEVETLEWKFVDRKSNEIRLPDSKSGEKTVPVGQSAIDLLEVIRARQEQEGTYSESGFVIPGRKHHLVGLSKMWRKWRSEAGIKDVRVHDLRHTYGSFGASGGTPLFVISGVLGHKSTATTERYAHLQPNPAKTAADSISSTIGTALTGSDQNEESFNG